MRDHPDAVHSAVLVLYLRQRRIARFHTLRIIARSVTVLALIVLAATAMVVDRPDAASSPLVRVLIGAGLLAWVVAVVLDFRVQAARLSSRILQMRLQAVQDRIESIAAAAANSQRERSAASLPSMVSGASA